MAFSVAGLALVIEAAVGYPEFLIRATGHPVMWIGALISALDARLNRRDRADAVNRSAGVLLVLVLLGVSIGAGWVVQHWCGMFVTAILGSTLLAQRSLYRHVAQVAGALRTTGLTGGRDAVSLIVGRDPESLDEAGVSRAAIESLAENFSDGIVAPAFWLAVGGLPCGAAYKAINTADSMVGHRTPRHQAFGWGAARLDDLINLPASRLSALLLVTAALLLPGAKARGAWVAVWRDAGTHRSPNAGWPEAAMAGALGLSLAGPRSYGGAVVTDAFMGSGRRDATAADITRALQLYIVADALLIALVATPAIAFLG